MAMPYNKIMLRLDPKKDANSWYIMRRLLNNKRYNKKPIRADRMKVSTLLQYCPKLPTYEEVLHSNRHVDDRIIQPFFKAVERLSEAFDYSFLTEEGKPIDYNAGLSYQEFASSELVITFWKDYPEAWLKQINQKQHKYRRRKAKPKK